LKILLEEDEEHKNINLSNIQNKQENKSNFSYYNAEPKSKKKISSKKILDNLLINMNSYGGEKYPSLIDYLKIQSELNAPRDDQDETIAYSLNILFQDIKLSQKFIQNFEKEIDAIKSSNLNNHLLTFAKTITFEDCEDESFLKFILDHLNPFLLNEANRINLSSKKLIQESKLFNYIITKLLSDAFYNPNCINPLTNKSSKCNLQTVYISKVKVNIKLVMNMFKYYNIKNIFLVDNCINDEDVKIISNYFNSEREKIFKPEGLYLFNNKLSDGVFEYLYSLAGRIDLINLNDNLFTDKSLRYMVDCNMPSMKNKTSFYLINCPFENWEILKNLSDEIYLYLSSNDIPQKIKKKLPDNIILE
jgi:hypothetical protein